MDWTKENRKDTELLRRVDRTPLDVGLAQGDEQLTALIEQHNASLLELDGRFKRLADDRAAMTGPSDQYLCTSTAIRTEYRRLIDESWDVLVTLRHLLGQRHALRRQMKERAGETPSDGMAEAHNVTAALTARQRELITHLTA